MSQEEYFRINDDADLYKITMNDMLVGGCRFLRPCAEEAVANGLSADEPHLLMGKIFVVKRFRSLGICTALLKNVMKYYKGETITILSYNYL